MNSKFAKILIFCVIFSLLRADLLSASHENTLLKSYEYHHFWDSEDSTLRLSEELPLIARAAYAVNPREFERVINNLMNVQNKIADDELRAHSHKILKHDAQSAFIKWAPFLATNFAYSCAIAQLSHTAAFWLRAPLENIQILADIGILLNYYACTYAYVPKKRMEHEEEL